MLLRHVHSAVGAGSAEQQAPTCANSVAVTPSGPSNFMRSTCRGHVSRAGTLAHWQAADCLAGSHCSMRHLCTVVQPGSQWPPPHLHLVLPGNQVEGCCQEDGPPKVDVSLLRRRQRFDKALLVGCQQGPHALVVSCAAKLQVAQWGLRPGVGAGMVCGVGGMAGHGLTSTQAQTTSEALAGSRAARPMPACARSLPVPHTWMHRSRAVALLVTPSTFCSATLALRYTCRQPSVPGRVKRWGTA